jgi:hypothetical protein
MNFLQLDISSVRSKIALKQEIVLQVYAQAYAHVSRQVLDSLPLGEDLGRHAVAFALVDSAPLANRNPGGILTSVLKEIERLMEIYGGRGGLCITQLLLKSALVDGARRGCPSRDAPTGR